MPSRAQCWGQYESPAMAEGCGFWVLRDRLAGGTQPSAGNENLLYTISTETDTVSVARIMYGTMDISRQLEETTEW